jgi:protein O-GlcNAc transferase
MCYLDKGLGKEAMECYEKAIVIKPDYAEVYNNLGIFQKEHYQFDKAILNYKKAVSIEHDFAESHNNLEITFMGNNRPDEAVVSFRKVLSIQPDFAQAHKNLPNVVKHEDYSDKIA